MKRLRILVVDDDRMNAKTLADILRITGLDALVAHSGRQALALLESEPLDCVLSDIRMPKLSGVALCREIRKVRPNLPAILMTAYSAESVVQAGLAEGVVDILSKPLDIPALIESLNTLAGGTG